MLRYPERWLTDVTVVGGGWGRGEDVATVAVVTVCWSCGQFS